jgi:geranylgeranyl diphosphate synthase type II
VKQTSPTIDASSILAAWADTVTDYFSRLFARYPAAPPRLMEAVEYSLLAGGKRLRPALVLECWRACTPSSTAAPGNAALAAAAAMELIHTFSLVHDDLPAMDDDDLRRGRPTNHKVFGEAAAILAGDAMVTMAFEVLAIDCPAELVGPLVRELASASGPAGMIGGQVLDMDEQKPAALEQLQRLHRMKTGALLTASCRMGAIVASADEKKLAMLDRYGRHLGLAFQIVDDLLDQTATPEQLGKATNKDAAKGKVTYPTLIGMDASRREADRNLAAALRAVSTFGPEAEGLRALARFVVERQM